jgi:hypothetical protein
MCGGEMGRLIYCWITWFRHGIEIVVVRRLRNLWEEMALEAT